MSALLPVNLRRSPLRGSAPDAGAPLRGADTGLHFRRFATFPGRSTDIPSTERIPRDGHHRLSSRACEGRVLAGQIPSSAADASSLVSSSKRGSATPRRGGVSVLPLKTLQRSRRRSVFRGSAGDPPPPTA